MTEHYLHLVKLGTIMHWFVHHSVLGGTQLIVGNADSLSTGCSVS